MQCLSLRKILREAVKIRTESLPKDHYWVAQAHSALGECLAIQKRYDEAEPLLLQSYHCASADRGTLRQLGESWKQPGNIARSTNN